MFPIDPKMPFQEYTILGMGSKKNNMGWSQRCFKTYPFAPNHVCCHPYFQLYKKDDDPQLQAQSAPEAFGTCSIFCFHEVSMPWIFFYTKHVAGVISWWYEEDM